MRKTLFALCSLLLAGRAIANLSGTDDFNDNVADVGKWVTSSSGISERNGRLEYAAALSEENEEQWEWVANRGSYTQDWSVIVDAHSALDPAGWSEQMVNFGLRVRNAADPTDDLFELSFEIAEEVGYGTFRAVIAEETTDGGDGAEAQKNIGAINVVSLCISFDAKTKTLSALYDIGSGYIALSSIPVSSWNMTDADTFVVGLGFSSEARSVAPGEIYGDNFIAAPTAVVPNNQPPVVTLRSPAGNPLPVNEGASVYFRLTANDSTDLDRVGRGMSNIIWYVDGTLKQMTKTGAPNAIASTFTFKTDAATVLGATFRDVWIRAVAMDKLGGATETNWVLRVNNVPASQTVTFKTLPVKALDDPDFAPGAVASSGLVVEYASSNEAVAQIVDGLIHIVGAGTAVVTANQPGSIDYKAATSVKQTLTVKARLTTEIQSGVGTVTGAGLYPLGTKVALTAKPSVGYTLLHWEDGSQSTLRSLLMPNTNVIVSAWFGITTNVPKPEIADPGSQRAMMGVPFSLPLDITSESLPTVTVTGLPTGLTYVPATKTIQGVPSASVTNRTVTIAAKNVNVITASQTFLMTVDPLPPWAQGSFIGAAGTEAPGAGSASMSVTAKGAVSGKLTLRGTNFTFNAKSYSSHEADGSFILVTTAKVGRVAWPLALSLNVPEITDPAGIVPGTLSRADGVLNADGWATLYRSVWKDAGMVTVLTNNFVGYYTAALPGGPEYGSGYLVFTVDKLGGVKTTGKLADGTAVSLAGTLVLDEAGRAFAVLYTAPVAYKGGCLYGLAEFFKSAAGAKVVVRPLGGEPFLWESFSPAATQNYGLGFDRDLGLDGGWYDTVGNLYRYYAGRELSIGTEGVPAPEIFVGTNRYEAVCWDPDGIAITVVTGKTGVMTGLVAPKPGTPAKAGTAYTYADTTNAVGLTVGLTRATGVFRGTFKAWFDYAATHTSKLVSYEGVLTPERADMADGVAGRGFFLWSDTGKYLNPQGKTVPYRFSWSYDLKILLSE